MLRLFGNTRLDKNEKLASTIFFYCDTDTLTNAAHVSKNWRTAISDMSIRKIIYETILKNCDFFSTVTFESFNIEQLNGGLTNTTFKLTIKHQAYAARLPGLKTENYINRMAEYQNASIADRRGVNAKILYYDVDKGAQVTVFLNEPISMTPETIQTDDNLRAVIQSLLKIHQSGPSFANDIDLFQRNNTMLELISQSDNKNLQRYQLISMRMAEIKQVIDAMNLTKTACHNDTTPTNFVLSDGNMYLIDWEYSGNNYPIWDLVCMAMESHFSQDIIKKSLLMYYDKADQSLINLFQILMPIYEYWVALWAGIQLANNNLADGIEGMQSLEKSRLESCEHYLSSQPFRHALDSLRLSNKIENAIDTFGMFGRDASLPLPHQQNTPSEDIDIRNKLNLH